MLIMVLTGSERGLVDTGTDVLPDARASSLSVHASLQGNTMTTYNSREKAVSMFLDFSVHASLQGKIYNNLQQQGKRS